MVLYLNVWSHCPNATVSIFKNIRILSDTIYRYITKCIPGLQKLVLPRFDTIIFGDIFFRVSQNTNKKWGSWKQLQNLTAKLCPLILTIHTFNYLLRASTGLVRKNFITADCMGTLRKRPRKPVAGWWMRDLLWPLTDSGALASEDVAPAFPHQLSSWSDFTVQTGETGQHPGKRREHKGWREEAQRRRASVFAGETPQVPTDSTRTAQWSCQHRDSGSDADFISSEMWCRAEYRTG